MKAMACIAIIFVMMMSTISAEKALVLVDIQNDYFLNGKHPLVGMEEASQNAKLILDHFRSENLSVIFIQHENDPGASFFIPGTWGDEISDVVKPLNTEPIVVKHFPNSFRNTTLQQELIENQVTDVVIVGAMSHMCIDSTTRAAADLGYNVTLIDDACATRDLEFNGTVVKAAEVHATYMGALGAAFSAVVSTEEYLKTESWREELRRLLRDTHSNNRDKALILVDIQNDYFSNGKYPLVGMEEASLNAKLILEHFRSEHLPVIFIQHVNDYPGAPFFIPGTWGDEINQNVKPLYRESVVVKHFPNSFRNTTLQQELVRDHIKDVVIIGAMSHMCIDSTARAAADLGYNVTVINDACATRNIEFNGTNVLAADVHAASMAALQGGFATVLSTEEYLKEEYWREELESLISY